MNAALIGVIVGGVLTMLGQLTLGYLQTRARRLDERAVALGILRVQRFYFYSAQHLIADTLRTGEWWPREHSGVPVPTDQDLRDLAALFSKKEEELWRLYTAAIRRLSAVLRIRESQGDQVSVGSDTMERLLGTFITLDPARKALGPMVKMSSSDEVPLDVTLLSKDEIETGLSRYASPHVDTDCWSERLLQA